MQDILKILIPIVVAHIVILVAIIFVIKRMLLGDTTRAMQRISEVEKDVRKKEEGIRRQIEEHEKEFERKKAEAEDEMARRQQEAEQETARTRERITAEANKEAERIVLQAKKNEQQLRSQIELEMKEKAVDYAGQIFNLVFSEKITPEINKVFTGELLDALEEVDGASITVQAEGAEFVTSHPLDGDQRERLEKMLAEKFNADVKVVEQIDESLLAGMILKLGSLEIDGTLLNRYREAAGEVKKDTAD